MGCSAEPYPPKDLRWFAQAGPCGRSAPADEAAAGDAAPVQHEGELQHEIVTFLPEVAVEDDLQARSPLVASAVAMKVSIAACAPSGACGCRCWWKNLDVNAAET